MYLPPRSPNFRNFRIPHALLGALFAVPLASGAAEIDFNRDIRPILSNACIMCHGPDEHERKGGPENSGGLRFDTEQGSRMDLGGFAAIVPGHPEKSTLLARITTTDADDLMPPKKSGKKVSAKEVQLLTDWIKAGAKYSKHWSYEPPVRPAVPQVQGTVRNPVDAFILQRLEKEKLTPQPEADRATLARRTSLDITGLPPSPETVESFVNDKQPDAYDHYVERLLDSPAYGEHWGREWLDLARYADSAGYADDPGRTIWGYRDYVIRAFNNNLPFDQFTVEQLAGDLLPKPTDDQLVATAFHRNTMTNSEGGTDDEEYRTAAIVDRVNTTMAVWMGTSMACAQCHTHKYDPITHHEYFQVYAILNNTADADRRDESPLHSVFSEADQKRKGLLQFNKDALLAELKRSNANQKAAAVKWAQAFESGPSWTGFRPSKMTSAAKLPMAAAEDGSVLVSGTAAKDVYTVQVPVATAMKLSALRIEALPHDSLPAKGPGHSGGNFVVTRLRATVEPPAGSKGPKARFVRIELAGNDKLLQLAEVQVFSGAANVAQQGVASQTSTFDTAVAARANDGNTAAEYDKGSVSHTGLGTKDPWWEVDLKSEQQLDRIVVWNRAEAGERLAGFRIVALDEKRGEVWEKTNNGAAPSVRFDLNGSREIIFADAQASYTQGDFSEEAVISDEVPAEKKKKKAKGAQKGWAIGGKVGTEQSLIAVAESPVEFPAGSILNVSIAQESSFANHTLGRFRLSGTEDAAITRRLALPSEVADALAIPAAQRDAVQRQTILNHYLMNEDPEKAETRKKLADIDKEMETIKPTTVPIFQELTDKGRRITKVQLRGNRLTLGDQVSEGVPAAWHPLPANEPPNRLALAKWLVDEKNPLTARVLANRYWEILFGVGLVRTSEEFGSQGELPSHPELLDWLATELVRTKWDMKNFVKLLVTSAAYRQSSKVAPDLLEKDPENRLLARGPRFRLSAEMVRDQALAVSGLLSKKMYGPSVRPVRPSMGLSAAFGGGLDWQPSDGEDRFRRALYTEWRRTSPYPSMTTFDAPNREVCTLRRGRSNTPLQALVTLNDPVYVEAAQALARRLPRAEGPDGMVRRAFQWVLSRDPSEAELQRILALHAESLAVYRADKQKATEMATKPIGPVPQGADVPELAAWTTVCSVLLNLDEALMKR